MRPCPSLSLFWTISNLCELGQCMHTSCITSELRRATSALTRSHRRQKHPVGNSECHPQLLKLIQITAALLTTWICDSEHWDHAVVMKHCSATPNFCWVGLETGESWEHPRTLITWGICLLLTNKQHMRTQFTADFGLKHYLKATIHKVNSLYLVENNRAALYTWHFGGKIPMYITIYKNLWPHR